MAAIRMIEMIYINRFLLIILLITGLTQPSHKHQNDIIFNEFYFDDVLFRPIIIIIVNGEYE